MNAAIHTLTGPAGQPLSRAGANRHSGQRSLPGLRSLTGLLLGLTVLCLIPPKVSRAQPAADARSPAPSMHAHVISAQDIRDSGVTRIGDILRLAPVFTDASLDGLRVDGSLFSSSPLGSAWRVAVDGLEIDRTMLGVLHPETLPVSVSRIERVVLEPPGMGPGGMSTGGWILIETSQPDSSGLDVMVSVGNETGDPGPFRYTEFATPNVDRNGPTLEARAILTRGVPAASWWTQVSMRADQAHLTDERLLDRVYTLYHGERQPRITLIHPRVEGGFSSGRSAHRVQADVILLRDLYFLEPLGAELPTNRRVSTLAASGHWLGDRTVTYSASASALRFDLRPNRAGLSLPWSEKRFDGRIGLSSGTWQMSAAVRARVTLVGPDEREVSSLIPLAEVGRQWGRAWSHRAGLQLALAEGGPVPGLSYEVGRKWDYWRFGARLSALADSPQERGSEVYWLSEGLSYPGRGEGRSRVSGTLSIERTLSLDVSVGRRMADSGEWGLHLFARAFSGQNLAESVLTPDSLLETQFLSERAFSPGHRGHVLGGRIWYQLTLGPHLRHQIHYAYRQAVVGEDLAFWQAWSPLPRTEMRYVMVIEPVPRTVVEVTARLRSSQSWPVIRTGPFTLEAEGLPAALRLDVTFSKALWGPRMQVFAVLQNVGGGGGRTHPLGPEEDLTLTAGLRLGL